MPRLTSALSAAALLWAGAARAETGSFTATAAIYADAKEGALKAPEGVACTDRAVVVADTGNKRLLLFTLQAGQVGSPKELKLAQLTAPVRVEIDGKGDILALDGKTHRIVRIGQNGAFAGYLEAKDAPGFLVTAFKVDSTDNAYLLDAVKRSVVVVGPTGAVARRLPLPEQGWFADVAIDPAGTIFTIDSVTATLWSAPKDATAFKAVTGSLKDRMSFPSYVTASKGRLYVVDSHGMGIVMLGPDGSFMGRQLSFGPNEGLVNYPGQLCILDAGEAFLADQFNNRVQMFTMAK